jgi:hypothetical protein
VELEFKVDEGDVLAFVDHHSQHSPTAREIRRRQTYGYAFLLAVFGIVFWFFGEAALAIAFLVLGPLWIVWWPARSRRLVRQQATAFYRESPSPIFDGPHVLSIDGAELVYVTPAGQSRMPVSTVQGISTMPDYVFIHVGPVQAVVVPRRRVSRGDLNVFVQHLEELSGPRTD